MILDQAKEMGLPDSDADTADLIWPGQIERDTMYFHKSKELDDVKNRKDDEIVGCLSRKTT